jgi:hypothetical protein
MLLAEPADVGGNRRRAGLDPPVIALDDGRARGGLALRVVENSTTSSCRVPWFPFRASA